MKNIHILPTSQPSRLWFHKLNRNLGFSDLPMEYNGSGTWVEGRNIYITNDEEIKEGDWFTDDNNSLKRSYKLSHVQFANPKKIILTTDQYLIKDGIQAIDDEFLEWFVKNPSCEFVEVVSAKTIPALQLTGNGHCWWKILIPKEEPKQEWDINTCRYWNMEIGCEREKCICENQEQDKNKYSEEDLDMFRKFMIQEQNFSKSCLDVFIEKFKKK